MSKLAKGVDAAALVATPAALILCALFGIKSSALLTLVVGAASMLVLLIGWERSKPAVEQIVPIVMMASLASAGRIAFAALPNIQPVTAICVISGCMLGPRSGFMVGALTAMASNCLLGQGPWTPWQMYGWGLVGFLSGALFYKRAAPERPLRAAVCAFGFLASFAYGAIMDTWALVGFTQALSLGTALAVYGAGVAFNATHALSTLAFLLVLYVPWCKKMMRYKDKLSGQIVANDNSVH